MPSRMPASVRVECRVHRRRAPRAPHRGRRAPPPRARSSSLLGHGCAHSSRHPGRDGRVASPRPHGAGGCRRARRGGARRRRARHLHAVGGEADPGTPSRARLRRPRRGGRRHRVRLARSPGRAARGGQGAPCARRSERGRPRVRRRGRKPPHPQLLGEARRLPLCVRRAGLAVRGLPAPPAPAPGTGTRCARRRGQSGGRPGPDRGRRLRGGHRRPLARADGRCVRPARSRRARRAPTA